MQSTSVIEGLSSMNSWVPGHGLKDTSDNLAQNSSAYVLDKNLRIPE